MDARHEGSERERGSAAPEEGAPGAVTGDTPLPGPRPAGEAVPLPEPGTAGPETGAPENTGGPEKNAVSASDEPEVTGPDIGAPDDTAAPEKNVVSASEEPESPEAGAVASAPSQEPTVATVDPALPQEPASAPAGLDGAEPGGVVFPEYPEEAGCPGGGAPVGLAALSLPSQIAAALALAVVAVVACVHLGMVFLHVAPSNTVTKQHGSAIDDWIYPEFEQNWKLFAPNPLQQDIAVQVRALVRTEAGISRETGWYDLSALDALDIDGNLLPSHTQQNELRRAWDLYLGTHDGENRAVGLRGDLSEQYLRRIGVLRLDREHAGGEGAVVERLQFRSLTTDVPPPRWSDEKVSDRPVVRELPWWTVPGSDRADGRTEASAR
ncbi:DUF5819 family protein [Streptomyces sp. NPDC001914]|uniref:DUF5819 family protein n=1 Tax=Streptomyces sp. NPDC001914 TaxID=3364623 RepID=UPI0036867111